MWYKDGFVKGMFRKKKKVILYKSLELDFVHVIELHLYNIFYIMALN